jgi:hypothetical protein
MTQTQRHRRLLRLGRRTRPGHNRPRRDAAAPEVVALERRGLQSVVALAANASPMLLTPINGMNQPHAVVVSRFRPVTLAGTVTVNDANVPTVSFQVIDEYGKHQPSGTFQVQVFNPPAFPGRFFFTNRIGLNLTRRPGDHDGRQYQVMITAQDQQSTQTIVIPVTTLPRGRSR